MAALRVQEQSQSRLVLGTGLGQRVSGLLSTLAYLFVGAAFLSQFFDSSFGDNPLFIIGILFLGFLVLSAIYSALVSTRVVLDTGSRLTSRSTYFLAFPLNQSQVSLDRVRRVLVQSRAPVSFNQASNRRNWQVVLEPTDGAPLVVNSAGTHDEMLALGNQVGTLLNRPVADDLNRAGAQTAAMPDYQPIQDFSGQGRGRASYAPPVAAPTLLGGSRPSSSLPEKTPPPNTLTTDSESPEHARFEQEATQPASTPTLVVPMPPMDMGMPPLSTGPVMTDMGTPPVSSAPSSMDTGTSAPATTPATAGMGTSMPPATPPTSGPSMPSYSTPPAMDTGMPSYSSQPAVDTGMPSYSTPSSSDTGTSSIFSPPAMELPDQPPIGSIPTEPSSFAPLTPPPPQPSTSGSSYAPARTWSYDELMKAIQADPTDSMAYYRLARFWQSRRSGNQALDAYQNAVRLDPMNGTMQNDLGVLYYQRGNFKDAETALRRAIGRDPFAAVNHYNLGLLLMRTGRRAEAQQEFSRAASSAASEAEQRQYTNAQNGMLGEPLLSPQP